MRVNSKPSGPEPTLRRWWQRHSSFSRTHSARTHKISLVLVNGNQGRATGRTLGQPRLISTPENNTISGNRAVTGGGIDVFDSSPRVVSNEFQNNTAGEDGGGIWVGGESTLILNEPDDNIYSGNQPDDIYYEPD